MEIDAIYNDETITYMQQHVLPEPLFSTVKIKGVS